MLTAKVRPGRVSQFNALIREQQSILRQQPGLVYVKLARRLEADGSEEVVLFEEWRDPQSVYEWAGPDLSRPRLLPGSMETLIDVSVVHYEALDLGPDETPAGPWQAVGSEGAGERGDLGDGGDRAAGDPVPQGSPTRAEGPG